MANPLARRERTLRCVLSMTSLLFMPCSYHICRFISHDLALA